MPKNDEHLPIRDNEQIKSNLVNLMNLSMGFNARDTNNKRLTAPYIKVF